MIWAASKSVGWLLRGILFTTVYRN